jgi:hypothetical protein
MSRITRDIASTAGKDVAAELAQKELKETLEAISKAAIKDTTQGVSKDLGTQLSKMLSKESSQSLAKKIAKDATNDLAKGVSGDIGNQLAKSTAENVVKMSTAFGKDALTTVAYRLKTGAKQLFTDAKLMLKNIGGKTYDLAKKYPKLFALGLTAAGIAIYAAAKGITYKQACKNLLNETAEGVKEIAGTLNEVACDGIGVCPSKIFDNFSNFFLYFGIGLGIIVLLIVIYYIFSIRNNFSYFIRKHFNSSIRKK